MAKRSAKSKGYRKQVEKKPYLSKRDIVVLCVVAALLAVGAFFLFRYDDGALKVKDGAVVANGENWLIANGSNVRGGARYYKLGEIGEIDGYSREKGALSTDPNVPEYAFTPVGDDIGDVRVTVTAARGSAEAMAKYTHTLRDDADGITAGEVQTTRMAGQDVCWYGYVIDTTQAAEGAEAEIAATEEASAEDAPAASHSRSAVGYIDASHDCCVVLQATSTGDSEADCLDDDALYALLEKAAGTVKVDEAKG